MLRKRSRATKFSVPFKHGSGQTALRAPDASIHLRPPAHTTSISFGVRMEPGGHCSTSWRSTPLLPGGHGQRSTMHGQTRPRQIQDQMTRVLSIRRRQESHTCMCSVQSLWVLQ
jgi:hypothetical protein